MTFGDDLPYRNNAIAYTHMPQPQPTSSEDERTFSTLKEVRRLLAESVEGLYKDFNAFQVDKNLPRKEALQVLQRQIDGKQEAYDILAPLLESVDSVLDQINLKYKER